MNTIIEQSVAAWLGSLPGFAAIQIHAGQSDEEIPNDSPIVYVVCNSTESPARSLYTAGVQIVVSTPEIIQGNLAVHQSIITALRDALRSSDVMSTFFPPSTVCAGASLGKWDDSQDNNRWTTAVSITLGIVDAHP